MVTQQTNFILDCLLFHSIEINQINKKKIVMGIKRTSDTIHPVGEEVVLPVPKRSKRHRFKTFRQRIDEVGLSVKIIYIIDQYCTKILRHILCKRW